MSIEEKFELPSPYDLLMEDLSVDFVTVAAIRDEIDGDPGLNETQKAELKDELFRRWAEKQHP